MNASKWLSENVPNIEAREYQLEAWEALWKARAHGQPKGLIQLATGLGKTLVAAVDVLHYLREEHPSARILFVSHVRDINTQARETFTFVSPDITKDTTFATFQSLHRRLTDIAPDRYDYIIYDEAHHSEADTFKAVREHFKPKFTLALTATPERGDGRDIMDYFGDPAYAKTLPEGIAEGWLSPVDYHLVLDETLQKAVNGNFKMETLGEIRELFKVKVRDERIAREVQERQEAIGLANAQTIVFCQNIESAQHIARVLGGKPYYADLYHVERKQTLQEFRSGKLTTICTVDMFNEGIDIPNARLIVFLRSTSSRTIFEQQLGRGLRKAPGKEHVTVLDFAANIERISFARDLGHTISKLRGMEESYPGLNVSSSSSSSSRLFDFGTTFDFEDTAVKLLDRYRELQDRTFLSRDEVVAAYNEMGKSIPRVAEKYGVSWNAIYKHLRAAGIDTMTDTARAITTEQMMEAYKETGTLIGVSKKLGVSPETVRGRFKAVGFEYTPTNQKEYASPELIEAFERLGSVRSAAEELGIGRHAARNKLINSGKDTSRKIKTQRVSGQELRAAYEAFNGDIASIVAATTGNRWKEVYEALDKYGFLKRDERGVPLTSAQASAAYFIYGAPTAAEMLECTTTMIYKLSKTAKFIKKFNRKRTPTRKKELVNA